MPKNAASLRALLAHLIDYAGLYPPAGLPLGVTVENYARYLASEESWILGRLVLPATKLADAHIPAGWRITLLVEGDPPPNLPPQVETFETKQPRRLSLPTYCEAALEAIPHGAFAKVRTGGLTPDRIPSTEQLGTFLTAAAARRMPFKATAGLHHPLRSLRPLTYAEEAPHAVTHGFVNVFAAAAFAWQGSKKQIVIDVLNDIDPAAFTFTEAGLRWRGERLTTPEIEAARRDFAHSFGSCSFEEPVQDLRKLGWL